MIDKNVCPYYAQINFNIEIYPLMEDGSLHPDKFSKADFLKHNISDKAVLSIKGFNVDDCIEKLKEVLGNLHYEE